MSRHARFAAAAVRAVTAAAVSPVVESLEGRLVFSTIAALSIDQHLLIFDSTNTRALVADVAITGLQPSEDLVGMDVRPATGELYALGSTGNLYSIVASTGAATLKATLAADPSDLTPYTALAGANYGLDFDPVADRLRVVNEADQNLSVNPDTGLVISDTPIIYDAGDQNSDANPLLVDIGYTNNVAGATSTTLLGFEGVDPEVHNTKILPDGTTAPAASLVRVGGIAGAPGADTGLLFTVGPVARNGAEPRGMDIAADGTLYQAFELNFPDSTQPLYNVVRLNPDSGVDTALGYIGNGQLEIEDIAVLPTVQFSAQTFAAVEGSNATVTLTRTDGGPMTLNVDVTALSGTALVGQDFTASTQSVAFAAGETTKTIEISITADNSAEEDEFFVVNLSNLSGGGTLGANRSAVVRISANGELDDVPPQVKQVLLTGPSRAISGAVIHFNEDINTDTAQNVANYSFAAKGKGKATAIALSSAVYDAGTRTVRLTATQAFMQTNFKQLEVRVKGKGGGVTDVAGNALDGTGKGKAGSDAVFRFGVFSGTSVTLTDRDGDIGTLSIANGGRLDGIVPLKSKMRTQRTQFWILDPIALRSILTGAVQRGPRGDGIVVIAEIIGLDKKEFTPLLTNPSFRVNTLTFSSNATGIG